MWNPIFLPQLGRIEDTMHDAIVDLKRIRRSEVLWAQAFDSIIAISRSTHKHLVGPQLVLLGHSASQNHSKQHLDAMEVFAAGVELHHVFMLIHDDIADSGTIRRGMPTISVALADATPMQLLTRQKLDQLATVIGDAVHARSMSLLFKGSVVGGAPDACEAILQGAYRAGAAQFDDIAGWSSVEELFKSGKTSDQVLRRLMSEKRAYHGWISPLLAGLRLGFASSGNSNSAEKAQLEGICHAWAERMGIAYQALDDLADLLLPPGETGKDSLQDLRDGRLSMPVFLLMQRAAPKEREMLKQLLMLPDAALLLSDRRRVLDLMDKYKLQEAAIQFAKDEVAAAKAVLVNFQQTSEATPGNTALINGMNFFNDAISALVVALAERGEFLKRPNRLGLWLPGPKGEMCDSIQHCVVP